MPDWLITAILGVSTVLSMSALVWSIYRLRADKIADRDWWGIGIIGVATFLDAAAAGGRHLADATNGWAPIESHVDGLLFVTTLLGALLLYLKLRGRIAGLDLFTLAAMSFFSLWGVCASWFTLRAFAIGPLEVFHYLTVYIGAMSVTVAAASGACFLYVQRVLKDRQDVKARLKRLGRLAKLETVERFMLQASLVSFASMTLLLISGAILQWSRGMDTWQDISKFGISIVIWLIFAVVIQVKLAPMLRGSKTAYLSISGFILLLIVMSISLVRTGKPATANDQPTTAAIATAVEFDKER